MHSYFKYIFLLALFFFSPLLHADAATYYVDSSCANNGNGLAETCAGSVGGLGPLNSIANAKAKAGGYTAGDFLLFKRGQTFPLGSLTSGFIINWAGTVGNPITFGAYDTGAAPIINAAGSTRGFDVSNVSNITIEDLTIQGPSSAGLLLRGSPSLQNITVENVTLTGSNLGDGITFATPLLVTNVTFSNVVVENFARGFLISVGSTQSVSNITVTDSTFSNNTATGFEVSGGGNLQGMTISGSNFTFNGGRGIRLGRVRNLIIEDTIASNNTNNGLEIFSTAGGAEASSPITITNLTANENSADGLSFGSFVNTVSVSDSNLNGNNGNGLSIGGNASDITISTTNANENSNDGFNVTGGASNISFERVTAEDNGYAGFPTGGDGISFHSTSNGSIIYSLFKNNEKSGAAHVDGSSVFMRHNIFSHDTSSTWGLVTFAGSTGLPSSHTLYNNILYSGSGTGFHMYGGGAGDLSVDARNNIITGFGTGILYANGNLTENNNLLFNNTTDWSGTTAGAGSFVADPLFVNAGAGDFTLQPTSPAIDAGTYVGSNQDYEGNDIVGNTDIGAFEYQPPANNAPTNITSSLSLIDENIIVPFTFSTLTTTDPDGGDTHTYSFTCTTPGADDASFNIVNTNELSIITAVDYETKASYDICIRTTDQGSLSYDKNFTITVNDIDETVPVEPTSPSSSRSSSTTRYCSGSITSFCRPTTSTLVVTTTNPFNGEQCPSSQLLTNNMKQGDRNGTYSTYQNGTITEVNLLQAHINRILGDEYTEAAGPIDGIFGPQTKLGVQRLQQRLNTLLNQNLSIDGIVGPYTRSAINVSC